MIKPITIKEIASKAGVSIGTVDRVLHNRGRVSESTREKVLKIAKEGNYTSNVLARHLKLNKTYIIQVILPKENNYWLMLKDGIEQGRMEYERMGFTTRYLFMNDISGKTKKQQIKDAFNSEADGFIIAPSVLHKNEELLAHLKANNKPYVLVDSRIDDSGYLSYIGQDAFTSGILAARLLHDKYIDTYDIFIITFEKSALKETTITKRIKGFKKFFNDANVKNANIYSINLEKDNFSEDKVYQMLKEKKNPVHVFVPNSKAFLLSDTFSQLYNSIQMRIVAYDLLPANMELLNNGIIDFLIHQKPQQQGYLGIQSLYKHMVLKMDVTENQFMPLDIITKENVLYCQ